MPEDQPKSARPSSPPPAGGVRVEGQQVSVGGDVAGRDVVRTTYVGMGPQAVQRMVMSVGLLVGVLVFFTAACFFSGGIVVGGAAIAALGRKVESGVEKGQRMQAKLEAVRALPAGQAFQLTFTEDEISSYVRFIAGPQIGLTDGKVRLLDANTLVIGGQVSSLGNLPVAATFELQNQVGQPLRLTSAAVHLIQLQGTNFGWVAVPTAVLQQFADQVNQYVGGNYQLIGVTVAPGSQPARTVSGVVR